MKATVNRIGDPSGSRPRSKACARFSVLSTQYPVARRGLTLLELLIVISVLSVVATLVLPAVGNFLSQSRSDVTQQSLTRLRDVIAELTGRTQSESPAAQSRRNARARRPA